MGARQQTPPPSSGKHAKKEETEGKKDDHKKKKKCPYCKKDEHGFPNNGQAKGNGQTLAKSILSQRNERSIQDHEWYTGNDSLAAHHLICSEMEHTADFRELFIRFGWNINSAENGVMLPMKLKNACQLHVPLHRSSHKSGMTSDNPPINYPTAVRMQLQKYVLKMKKGKYCQSPHSAAVELNNLSKEILQKIDAFEWTLTADGRDYMRGGIGCANVESISNKPNSPCNHDRDHQLVKQATTLKLHYKALRVGY